MPKRSVTMIRNTHAYDYWFKSEGPYPTQGGTIPDSPRGEILMLMIREQTARLDDLFAAAKDPRSEVSGPARNALLTQLSISEPARNEFVRRVQAGEVLDGLLEACLRARTPFSDKDVQSIAELLASARPQTRYAAAGILELQYLPLGEIRKWAEMLQSDPYQHLRDKGHERIEALKRAASGAANLPGSDIASA